jgi:dTMP kinase
MLSSNPLQFYAEPLPGVDCAELRGKLIVVEGPDAVGRTTQIALLRQWLEQEGHAVLDTGMARSALAGRGIQEAKRGNTLGPMTMTLFYVTDFADRLENEILPALRAGFVVLIDRYIFSIMARAIARSEDRRWIEQVAACLVPHAVCHRDAGSEAASFGRGALDYWESGMTCFGATHQSFVRYQTRWSGPDRWLRPISPSTPAGPRTIFEDLRSTSLAAVGQGARRSAAPLPGGGLGSADGNLHPPARSPVRGRAARMPDVGQPCGQAAPGGPRLASAAPSRSSRALTRGRPNSGDRAEELGMGGYCGWTPCCPPRPGSLAGTARAS